MVATLTKIAFIKETEKLPELIQKYSGEFLRLDYRAFTAAIHYVLFKKYEQGPALLILHEIRNNKGYNCIFTVTADDLGLAVRIEDEFFQKTGIDLRKAPYKIVNQMRFWNSFFETLKQDPKTIIESLKELKKEKLKK